MNVEILDEFNDGKSILTLLDSNFRSLIKIGERIKIRNKEAIVENIIEGKFNRFILDVLYLDKDV